MGIQDHIESKEIVKKWFFISCAACGKATSKDVTILAQPFRNNFRDWACELEKNGWSEVDGKCLCPNCSTLYEEEQ